MRRNLRKLTAIGAGAALLASSFSAVALPAVADEGRIITLVGSLQSEIGCSDDWQPSCEASILEPTGTEGVYESTFTLPAGNYEYKVAVDQTWDEAYPGENVPLIIEGESEIKFTFDYNQTGSKQIELTPVVLGDYTAADDALVAAPVRQAGATENFYFVMTDRFKNGDESNDTAGIAGDRLAHGFDPTDKGFYNGGDIAGLRSELDYIKGLGTTAIWLTPSFKNRPVQGQGADASAGYHGYWVTDFTQIDPHLGTNAELEALIAEAQAKGMKVYFDIITNHTADIINYEEGRYNYIPMSESPYTDADGVEFNPSELAKDRSASWPVLDPATSFPYTPVVDPALADIKVPAWLNDSTLYHNRGNSTWEGESETFGDFDGLDDLMTEHPDVVDGFIDIYKAWIDMGIDGFRIDTAKHVNFEFWEDWTTPILNYAKEQGKSEFFMFGEVYSADQKILSPYVRGTDMNSVLDFAFQAQVSSFAAGNSTRSLQSLFASDDYYTTPNSSATALPTFLGNHDMGRIGFFMNRADNSLKRNQLAHELMYLTRGQPVVYYGDEQGFTGLNSGNDKDARQSLFATEVAEYANQELITGENAGSVDRFDTDSVMYETIAELAELRKAHPALLQGAQIQRYSENGAGVYAFSRVDRDEKIEYLVASNNSADAKSVDVTALTKDAQFSSVFNASGSVSSNADGVVSLEVPALTSVVYKADAQVSAPSEPGSISISAPRAGAALGAQAEVSATIDADTWAETSFAYRVLGSDGWVALGTAESTSPRVFHDVKLPKGTIVEYRAVSVDAAGNKSAASSYASVGNAISISDEEQPEAEIELVTIPGNHQLALGCSGDWVPACEASKLVKQADGSYEGTFDLAAGTYEYKVALNGSWDLNYGVGGVQDGSNVTYTHEGGPITFIWDPVTKRFQNTAQGPIITLAGSFQSQVGCSGDWQPNCLAAWMHDDDGDGIWEWSTQALADGSYELKVTHGRSWDENYGQDGVPGGNNITFSVTEGKLTKFRYNLETHVLEIESEDPPLPGVGQLQAQWIDADTVAWPANLIKEVAPNATTWTLYSSATADLALDENEPIGADESVTLTFDAAGLSDAQKQKYPHLSSYLALKVSDVDRTKVAQLLTTQLQIGAEDAAGAALAFTGVQLPGVLDALYSADLADTKLGVEWANGASTFRVWAPTAQSATLLTWAPGGEGDATRHEATFDSASGVWSVADAGVAVDSEYLWEVEVYAHSTRKIETNQVTDPYSVALTLNSTRSVAADIDAEQWQPTIWSETPAPIVERQVDRAIYELHVRDFSITDETVPEAERGTYRAFTRDSNGTRQLREIAEAGINTVHLLPTFDIATIEEDRALQAVPDCDLAALTAGTGEGEGPAGTKQQECINEIKDQDGFNWGYDPYNFQTPEGSYAVDAHGGARISEFREMVGALHGYGLQVVLDKVFNHTAQSGQGEKSVLDQVVPGYYHRLNAAGGVETSTCCENVATENAAAEKLMVDSVVLWASKYKVDGFRFDLMGHHSKENMLNVRAALDELTLENDGVDGKSILLYGEGWNFGEVADGARFEQAIQGNLGGTGIATFSDRLRDAVHGGSPVDGSSKFTQGFGTGLATAPNSRENRSESAQFADLAHQTDLVKLGLAGNLSDFTMVDSTGAVKQGSELDYRGAPAGYASQPEEIITYVDAHDNETLFDIGVFKLNEDTTIADRVRMNTLSLATATLAQTPSFWHAGTELLRSKSLDRDSYNSGDWFNRIDWTGKETTFGSGLPPAEKNEEHWGAMRGLLTNENATPTPAAIAASEAQALDLLRLRSEVDLFRLGTAELIQEKLSFPNSGVDATPGLILMSIDDTIGERFDAKYSGALVVFNASPDEITEDVAELAGRDFALSAIQLNGSDEVVKSSTWNAESGTVTIPARTVAVFLELDAIDITPLAPTQQGDSVTIPVQQGVSYVDAAGNPLSGTVQIPEGGLVVKAVLAEGLTLAEGATTEWTFERGGESSYDAALELDRNKVVAGDSVTVSGSGFMPGERVQLWFQAKDASAESAVLLATPIADAEGKVSAKVTVPAGTADGFYTITGTGISSDASASVELEVTSQPQTGVELGWGIFLALALLLAGGMLVLPRILRRKDAA